LVALLDAQAPSENDAGAGPGVGWAANAGLITAITILISVGNYLYSFLVVHLTRPEEFSRFSAAQGLLVVLGSGSVAAVPWAMARFIAEHGDNRARRQAMHFGLIATSVQGVVFALIAGLVLGLEAGVGVGVIVGVSALIGSVSAVPIGFLQGVNELPRLALLRGLEFIVRFCCGVVILLVVSRTATAALIGYPVGATVLLISGLRACRSGLPPRSGSWKTIGTLARQSGGMGGIQVSVTMLGALDTVAVVAAHVGTVTTASYQSAVLLGRTPIFLSLAIGVACYVHVVQARDEIEVRQKMRQALRLYAIVVTPVLIALLSVPSGLLHILIPSSYSAATGLLRFSVLSGALIGWIDIVSTAHQARARFRPALWILGLAAAAQPILLIVAGRTEGIWVFAATLVVVSALSAAVLSWDAREWLSGQLPWRRIGLAGAGLGAAVLLRQSPVAWIGLMLVISAITLGGLRSAVADPTSAATGGSDAP
jgi:O-antigen/teichoic acid export membrane protein